MNIKGKKVTLRAIEEDDLQQLHAWSNDPEIWPLLGGWHFPCSMASTRRWFEGLAGDSLNQRFAIDVPGIGLVGTANLIDIDWKNNNAFHGMMLGSPEIRGKGIGVDTVMAIMRYAFDELHLARLDGSMIEYNDRSIAMYCNRCNWKVEGRQRNWYFRNGRYWDRIIVGVTREDYQDLILEKNYWDGMK
ncbi:GNAT family N-acetyltransferase [Novispirillum itersonii]|uniref:GNAT family N-acetyltransferase n=1 Tax=Novispirillum itersonii TaxID=189 RepID=UPI00035D024D|nr:GNAT family protein [Novispirillum itersonii]